MEVEQWRDIPGYEGLYQVSDQGRVLSMHRGRYFIMKPQMKDRYWEVNLTNKKSYKTYRIHSLMMLAFIGPRPADHHVDHINSDRFDNRLVNLRYLHRIENEAQGALGNAKRIGELHPRSKLSNEQRCEIVRLWDTGRYSQRELASQYGVSKATISDLVNGISGAQITGRQKRPYAQINIRS